MNCYELFPRYAVKWKKQGSKVYICIPTHTKKKKKEIKTYTYVHLQKETQK